MEQLELLKEASNNIYDFGSNDASDVIAKLNLRYGLGKMIWALNKRNIDTNKVLSVTTPDSGITRNKQRWQAGFSYGCLIRWPSQTETGAYFAFPQIKPNACGMLVAKINKIPKVNDLCDKLHEIEKNGLEVKSTKLKLNVGVSNHFIEICKVGQTSSENLKHDDHVAIIHTSPSELIKQIYDFDMWVAKGGAWEDTPLGPLLVLEGDVAKEYIDTYKEIDEFSKKKRLALAKHLFGDYELVSNPTHQGLFSDNEARLGLYRFDNMDQLYPVTFRWDINVYLMKPMVNIEEKLIAEKTNGSPEIKNILTNLNMLPHGGGYEIPFSPDGWRVMQNGSKRLFAHQNKEKDYIFSSPSDLPYNYRGLQIVDEIAKLKLSEVAAKLKQVYTLKY